MKMQTNKNIKYKLSSIEHDSCILDTKDVDLSQLNEDRIKFQYKIEAIIKIAENLITISPGIRFIYNNTKILEASASVNFIIKPMEDAFLIDKENQKLDIKVDILPAMISASYSTLRGIVYSQTIGTPLSRFPIPLIESKTLTNKTAITVEDQ